MRRITFLILVLLCVFPRVASALSLDEAKSRGLVGEEPSGYLGAVEANASGEVQEIVQHVNSQRKLKYAEIAQSSGTTLAAVEGLAGKKAIDNTAPGHYVKRNGSWVKK